MILGCVWCGVLGGVVLWVCIWLFKVCFRCRRYVVRVCRFKACFGVFSGVVGGVSVVVCFRVWVLVCWVVYIMQA